MLQRSSLVLITGRIRRNNSNDAREYKGRVIVMKPYFMTNAEWWGIDWETRKVYLTDNAPLEARKSYEEFWKRRKPSDDRMIVGLKKDGK